MTYLFARALPMVRSISAAVACLVWSCFLCAPGMAQKNFGGSAEIRFALEKLQVTGSALMIAAHPDDENTAVIAYFARGRKMHMGYLSLNRGEGGQNLLGAEQGALIGLIRTQELLRAREIDGGVQYFTRVVDFGYSKVATETLGKWGKENALRDVVWVIRKFQPDVIINRFSGTPMDGHGHHQSSALLSKEAFHAAADPKRFPEQLQWVQPWQAKRLFWNTFTWRNVEEQVPQDQKRLVLPSGNYDPLLGHSYQEIAGMSRSMHRSQTMGTPERKGEAKDYLVHLDGPSAERDPFEGIDTTWGRVEGSQGVQRLLSEALATFDFLAPEKSVPVLLEARRAMQALPQSPLVARKLLELEEVIGSCTGLWLDASAAQYEVVPGSTMRVNLEMVNRSPLPVSVVGAELIGQQGLAAKLAEPVALPANQREVKPLTVALSGNYPISQPYWLKEAVKNDLYQIAPEDEVLVGMPESPASYHVKFDVLFGEGAAAQRIVYTRPLHHRYVDPMYGELTRALVVTPPVTLELGQQAVFFPGTSARRVDVTVTSHQAKLAGEVALALPTGWRVAPAKRDFTLAGSGEKATLSFEVTPPAGASMGELQAYATVNGQRYERGMIVVDYPHFPPQTLFPRQTARLVREPLQLLSKRIGYVMGAGDEIPQALEQMGGKVTLLTESELGRGDLSGYDAIITGVRAYNTRPDLVANHKRLLDYAERGGTLVVQYNTTRYFGAGAADPIEGVQLGPFPFQIGRDRVSVEDAPVTILRPEHALLNRPNRVTAKDFEGWVQERGLYFPAKFDERYETLIATHDPNEESLSGGILYTRLGKGAFVFTSYSWFRQLPAGVPGASKLFANLVSAGKLTATK
ncbi:MAG: PIG-L family deacetylase [Bryobacterales bacterium]|jgi:LmbE family N-acetylglucosaminyl deacetylase|nr:PIG-L family deacetylase [Bryobacterales bacterium]